jgi:hypothetical protein
MLQNIYNRLNISQLFCELVVSEAFENSDIVDIEQFFLEFLSTQQITPVFLSCIYAIDERYEYNWENIFKLFNTKYKQNPEVLTAIATVNNTIEVLQKDDIK